MHGPKRRFDTLRYRLREGTHDAHERVDVLLRPLDLTTREGMITLLQVQHLGLSALKPSVVAFEGLATLPVFIKEAEQDLALLGAGPISEVMEPQSGLHPLGVAYVLAGANSGGKLLLRAWGKAEDAQVRGAGQFLTATAKGDRWGEVVTFLNGYHPDAGEEATIIATARQCFATFEAAARRVLP